MYDPLEKPYDELQKVLQSFKKKGNEVMNQNKASSDAAAGAGGESTTNTPLSSPPTLPTTKPSIEEADSTAAGKGEDFSLVDAPMPKTFDEAMDRINKLKNMRFLAGGEI